MSKMIPRSQLNAERALLESEFMHYYRRYEEWLVQSFRVREYNREQISLKDEGRAYSELQKLPPNLSPMLVNATVGIGKSKLLAKVANQISSNNLPMLVCAPTHDLVAEHCDNIGAHHYYGRQKPEDKSLKQFWCYKPEAIGTAGSQNHRPAQSICRVCEHGLAGCIKNSKDDEAVKEARRTIEIKNIDLKKVEPCPFLYEGLPNSLSQTLLAQPSASFSEASAVFRPSVDSSETIQRLVVVDEATDLTKEIAITVPSIEGWQQGLERVGSNAKAAIKKMEISGRDPERMQQETELLAILPKIDVIFAELIVAIKRETELSKHFFKFEEEEVSLELAILAINKIIKRSKATTGGTARWERVFQHEKGEGFVIPLRALSTLAKGIETQTIRQTKFAIHAYEMTPILEWAIERGAVIFLDATASIPMRQIIESQSVGGKIIDKMIEQNMSVTWYTGHSYARGKVPKNVGTIIDNGEAKQVGESYKTVAKKYIKELEVIANFLPSDRPRAIITHKAYLKYSFKDHSNDYAADMAAEDFFKRTGVKIGWYGKHDRGHNQWSGHHIALVGMPILSTETVASLHGGIRSALGQAGVHIEAFNGEIAGEKIQSLPAQVHVRDTIIDIYSATVAQAIGRARAINNIDAAIQIHIWGGLYNNEMLAALARHGVKIDAVHQNQVHVSRDVYLKDVATDINAIKQAIGALMIAGLAVNREAVQKKLTGLGKKAARTSIDEILAEYRSLSVLPKVSRGRPAKIKNPNLLVEKEEIKFGEVHIENSICTSPN